MPDGFIASYNGALAWIINGSWFLSTAISWSLFSYFSRYMSIWVTMEPGVLFQIFQHSFFGISFLYLRALVAFQKEKLGELKFFYNCNSLISPIPALLQEIIHNYPRSSTGNSQIIVIALLLKIYSWELKIIIKKLSILVFLGLIIYSLFKLYSSVFILTILRAKLGIMAGNKL